MSKTTRVSVVVLFLLAAGPLSGGDQQAPPDVAAVEARYREHAGKNIQAHRKGDAVIEFRTNDGRPIPRRSENRSGKRRTSFSAIWCSS